MDAVDICSQDPAILCPSNEQAGKSTEMGKREEEEDQGKSNSGDVHIAVYTFLSGVSGWVDMRGERGRDKAVM
jgi:hypothetical protein